MKEMSLRKFLQERNNATIYESIVHQMQKTLEVVAETERAFNIYLKEDNILGRKIFERIHILENECDVIRRNNLVRISKSELTSVMREDFSMIAKKIDTIANMSDAAARNILTLDYKDISALGQEIHQLVLDMLDKTLDATQLLYNLFKQLSAIDIEETFKKCEAIQKLEHECDIIYSRVMGKLAKIEGYSFNPFTAVQITNLMNSIETVSDRVEDVSDTVEILKTAKL